MCPRNIELLSLLLQRTAPVDEFDQREVVVSEVQLYGEVALRFVSGDAVGDGSLSFLPGYVKTPDDVGGG